MKKYRYLNTDIFVENKGGRTIRLLQTNSKYKLSKIVSEEGKIGSIINCSYFTNSYVLGRNQGDLKNDTHDQEGFYDLVFLKDGTYRIGAFKSWDFCNKENVLAGFSVATVLIENGTDCEKFSNAICAKSKITGRNPQTAVAVLKNGDVLQIVADGRTSKNDGLTGLELRTFIRTNYDVELLCQLDGGGSTEMIVDGKIVNSPSDNVERTMFNGLAFLETGEADEPQEETPKEPEKEDETMIYKVLDVSSYQPTIDYKKVKADGVQGVILRCGRTFWGKIEVAPDDCFEKHFEGFKAVGMPIGVYYYSSANTVEKAREEAEYTLKVLKGKKLEYPVYFDVENKERQQVLSKQALTNIVKAYCEVIEKAGYYVGIYASKSWLLDELDMTQLKDYDVWVAQYNTKCTYNGKYGMWQYTSQGKVNGINGNVDLSNCYKDYPTIIKNAKLNGYGLNDEVEALKKERDELKSQLENLKSGYLDLEKKLTSIKKQVAVLSDLAK